MGLIDDLKKELAKQQIQKTSNIEILADEARRLIKDYCKKDDKKAGHALTIKEITSNVIIHMISKETDCGNAVYEAVEMAFNDLSEKGYFVERDSDKTLLITGAGVLWLNK